MLLAMLPNSGLEPLARSNPAVLRNMASPQVDTDPATLPCSFRSIRRNMHKQNRLPRIFGVLTCIVSSLSEPGRIRFALLRQTVRDLHLFRRSPDNLVRYAA